MTTAAFRPAGSIKAAPEDFKVQEIVDGHVPRLVMQTRLTGATTDFTKFILIKRGTEAQRAYREIATQLGVSRSQVTDYGMKDAVALTSQIIVVEGSFRPNFNHEKMWLCQIGPADGPVRHGHNEGNRFSILVRTEAENPPPNVPEFLNLFGPQRFGDGRVEIGKYLLEGNFAAALELIEGSVSWSELKVIMQKRYTALEALRHPDFLKTLQFKIQQWQSWLWNEVAKRSDQFRIPVWSPAVAEVYAHLWNPVAESLHPKMVQHARAFHRKVKVSVGNPVVKKHRDGFVHEFTLPSGVYATVYLAELYDLTDLSREKHNTARVSNFY